jgi:hypothetical protein
LLGELLAVNLNSALNGNTIGYESLVTFADGSATMAGTGYVAYMKTDGQYPVGLVWLFEFDRYYPTKKTRRDHQLNITSLAA